MNRQQILAALEGFNQSSGKSSEWLDEDCSRPKRPTMGDDLLALLDRVQASGYAQDRPAREPHHREYVWSDIDVDDPDYMAHEENEETGEEVYLPFQQLIDRIVADYQGKPLAIIPVIVNGQGAMGLRGFIEQMPEDATGIEFDLIHVERGENAAGQPTAKVTQDITVAVKGRDVLLLQWVVGTGCTTERVTAHLRQKNPASVKVCAMLDDVALRTTPVTVDYRVVEFERRAVIGVAKGEGFTFPCIAI